MNRINETTQTVPEQRGLPSYLLTHNNYSSRGSEATRYVLLCSHILYCHLLIHNISSYYTHIALYCYLSVAIYFSFYRGCRNKNPLIKTTLQYSHAYPCAIESENYNHIKPSLFIEGNNNLDFTMSI